MCLVPRSIVLLLGLLTVPCLVGCRAEKVPSISVVVPCHNHGSTLRRALDSVVESTEYLHTWQSGGGLEGSVDPISVEIVVVNDDSQDDTVQVARDFQAEDKSPVTCTLVSVDREPTLIEGVRKRRPGLARNVGVEAASGEVIAYLDADDVYFAPHLMRVVAGLRARPERGFVKTRMDFEVAMHPHWQHVIEQVSPINGAVRRDLHALVGGYLDIRNAEDASYWNMLRAVSEGGEGPQLGDAPTCLYVRTAGNHLERQEDKFAHPPEERARFEEPVDPAALEERRRKEARALLRVRERIEGRVKQSRSGGPALPAWLPAARALTNLGLMLKALHEPHAAEACFSTATTLFPAHAEGHYALGVLLGANARLEEAAQAYRAAITADPEHASALYNLAVLQRDAGDAAAAEASYRAAIRGDSTMPEAYNGLGALLWTQNRLEEAEPVYVAGLAVDPRHARMHNNLAGVYAKLNKMQLAEQGYRTALDIDPTFDAARQNLDALLQHVQRGRDEL